MVDPSTLRLRTDIPGLEVREHATADAGEFYEFVHANRDHLTRHGDYTQLVASTRKETERRSAAHASRSLRCGTWKNGRLVGHVTLVHGEPPRWGVGFGHAEDATGRGYMTASLAAIFEQSTFTGSRLALPRPRTSVHVGAGWAAGLGRDPHAALRVRRARLTGGRGSEGCCSLPARRSARRSTVSAVAIGNDQR